MSKLFVGNLDTRTSAATISEVFRNDGHEALSVQVVMSRDPAHSRGFAFVQMATSVAADAAVIALHGKEVEGRAVRVSIAKPPKSRFG